MYKLKRLLKKFKKFFKIFFSLLFNFILIAGVLALSVYMYITFAEADDAEELKIILEEQYENCIDFYEDSKKWISEKYEVIRVWINEKYVVAKRWVNEKTAVIKEKFNNKENSKEGLKLSLVGDFILSDYIDFTIPYEWSVTTANSNETDYDESVIVYSEDIMAIFYIQNTNMAISLGSVECYRDEMIKTLTNRHPEYTFKAGKIIDKRIAIINVENLIDNSRMHIAVVFSKQKVVTINYIYNIEAKNEAEKYFNKILDEISNSISLEE